MRACVQRVREAQVTVAGEVTGRIGTGLVVLLGIAPGDTNTEVAYLAEKLVGLRVFDDSDGKMNLSVADVGGSMLVVSQFTLYGDCRKGRRPSFTGAARPEQAIPLLDTFRAALHARGITTETGTFGAHMEVALVNDGPVTIWLDTEELFGSNSAGGGR